MAERVSCGEIIVQVPFDPGSIGVVQGECMVNAPDPAFPDSVIEVMAPVDNPTSADATVEVAVFANGTQVATVTGTALAESVTDVPAEVVPEDHGFADGDMTLSFEAEVVSASEASVPASVPLRHSVQASPCGSCGQAR